ncbi:MAG: thiamine-phosphate kinase [Methylophilus sp.]|nr:thiamine-phosphate kinase [Methylophilus sp.]
MTSEFHLIQQYFKRPIKQTDLGIGDDAALIRVKEGHHLVVSADMSVVGAHFFADAAPEHIGWKSLAVNVSDMAAMGAVPNWVTLSIALPEMNETWLEAFSRGFFACAEAFNIDLIGGDTTKGPLNIAVQIMGEVPVGKAIKRSGAQVGDDIWVSGLLGSAALGLAHLLEKTKLPEAELEACLHALNLPQPRVALGLALREIATSCIDISDGLLADLGHILQASGVGATVHLEHIPCLDTMKPRVHELLVQQALLAGGDDYELCFTAPSHCREAVVAVSEALGLPLTRIGEVDVVPTLNVLHHGEPLKLNRLGYDHFA